MMVLKALPRFRPMVWGNPELNRIFNLEMEAPVGEIWLLSGHPLYETPLEGVDLSLNELSARIFPERYPRFPLLIKLVSTNQWLSVQVHPDDNFAKVVEGEPWGKSEAWYFVTDGEFAICEDVELMRELIDKNRIDDLKDVMTFVKVRSGTIVNIPAGTVHALGPNSTVIEVQQSSDLTYRIYDWGRPRETHLKKAMKVSKSVRIDDIVFFDAKELRTDYFTMRIFSDGVSCTEVDEVPTMGLSILVPLELDERYAAYVSISKSLANQLGFEDRGNLVTDFRSMLVTFGPRYNPLLEE